MQTVFPFVQHDLHRHLLLMEVQRAVEQGAEGVLLCGSVARGTARPSSDLDLRCFWPKPRPFEATWHAGVLVERHEHSIASAGRRLEQSGSQLYPWVEGRILHDPTGTLADLQERAQVLLAMYRTPETELRALRHWIETALLKLHAMTDNAQRAFLVHTTIWKLAEGLCAVNDQPLPPSTLMWELLPGLKEQPDDWQAPLLLGSPEERVGAFQHLAAWVLDQLSSRLTAIS